MLDVSVMEKLEDILAEGIILVVHATSQITANLVT